MPLLAVARKTIGIEGSIDSRKNFFYLLADAQVARSHLAQRMVQVAHEGFHHGAHDRIEARFKSLGVEVQV